MNKPSLQLSGSPNQTPPHSHIDFPSVSLSSGRQLSQCSPLPLENDQVPYSPSCFSEFSLSITTEQIVPSIRASVISDDKTEVSCRQFKFEHKVQKRLKLLNSPQRYCETCRAASYFIERYELRRLGLLQFLTYWVENLKCCSEPKVLRKYQVKNLYCICCGSRF